MNLIDIPDEFQLITGIDIPVEDLKLTLRQPSLSEISMLGEQNYFIALQIFTINKENMGVKNEKATNWDIFQEALKSKIPGVNNLRALVSNFLALFFKETINIGPRSLMIMDKDGVINIEGKSFEEIQRIIGQIGGSFLLTTQEEKFNVKSRRAAEIAEKMKKARKRREQIKAAEQGVNLKESKKGFLSRFIKIVATKTANSLSQVNDMTLYQLNSLMKSYLAWEAYDLDIRSRLAGAKNDKDLIHWSMAEDSNQNSSVGTM